MRTVKEIIKKLALQPHPEGGYFKETYRSADSIPADVLDENFDSKRSVSTGIYYLLESGNFSALHKINQDEMWHFYLGTSVELTMIAENGELKKVTIGNNIIKGEICQFVVPKHYWFGAKLEKENSYALVGCTVAPGFAFNDFTLGKREHLLKLFPQHTEAIIALTRL